jgi:hypothetical protein
MITPELGMYFKSNQEQCVLPPRTEIQQQLLRGFYLAVSEYIDPGHRVVHTALALDLAAAQVFGEEISDVSENPPRGAAPVALWIATPPHFTQLDPTDLLIQGITSQPNSFVATTFSADYFRTEDPDERKRAEMQFLTVLSDLGYEQFDRLWCATDTTSPWRLERGFFVPKSLAVV